MNPRRIAIIVAALVLAAVFWWWRSHQAGDGKPRTPPVTVVELAPVRSTEAPVLLRAIGSVISPHTVQLRAQVSGTLKAIYFNEGDDVSAGQKLFQIDPAPYEAAVAGARAQLALDRASAAAAQAQFERFKPLAEQEYVTPQEFDNARAAADESKARVAASAAALRSAEIDLSRTLIVAPISGRTGSVTVKSGNLVTSGDSNPLLTINEVERLQVQFSLPQRDFLTVREALAQGPLAVAISNDRDSAPIAHGKLVFIDNAISETTGTVNLRAQIDENSAALWPGAFVEVALTLRVEPGALLVPEAAVQPGAEGSYVFVVGADHKVEVRTVVVDRQLGREMVISEGLKAGETVVAKAPRNLRPGTTVRDAREAAASAKAGSAKTAAKPQ